MSPQSSKVVHKDDSNTSPHVAQYGLMSQVLNLEHMEQSFWMTDAALLSQNLPEFVILGHD